jgi:RTX calcium-binding nonapeptide repeat (4 copies)
MNHGIMNSTVRFPRLGMVSVLAMVSAAGMGCSVQADGSRVDSVDTASASQYISTPLATAPAFHSAAGGGAIAGEVDITLADEKAEVYVNPADSSLTVNGQQVVDSTTKVVAIAAGTKANVKLVKVTDSTASVGDVLILNYVNGVFGLGKDATAGNAGTVISFKSGTSAGNTLVIKGTSAADSYAVGPSGVSLTMAAKAPASPTLDITVAHAATYAVFMGDGNDTFTSNATVTGGAFSASPPALAIYGGAGDDTLVESAASTPNETFSGGSGNDTVDYSLRTTPVWVAVDSTGTFTSGATPTVSKCSIDKTKAGSPAVLTNAGAAEGDVILDVETVKAGSGADFLMGDVSGALTLNGGLGNDTFCQGDNTYKNGTDTLVGGGGVDAVDYSLRANTLTVVLDGKTKSGDLTLGNASAMVKGENDVIGSDIQNVYMGSGGSSGTPSVYTGNALNNTFFVGTGGFATVNGSDGDDTLDEGTDPASTVTGVCDTGGVNPVCPDNSSASETFNGGKGTDTVDYHKRTVALYLKMDGAFKGGAGATSAGNNGTEKDIIATDVENLYGGAASDHLEGNANDNDIEGNGGAATGSPGDVLCGGLGNDTLIGNNAATTSDEALHGGDCVDTAEPGAFNMCFSTGAAGTPLTTNTANCQLVSQ